MSWAQRPVTGPAVTGRSKRVFNIDITERERCEKHNVRIVAFITAAMVIQNFFSHLDKKMSRSLIPQLRNLIPPQHLPPLTGPAQQAFNLGA